MAACRCEMMPGQGCSVERSGLRLPACLKSSDDLEPTTMSLRLCGLAWWLSRQGIPPPPDAGLADARADDWFSRGASDDKTRNISQVVTFFRDTRVSSSYKTARYDASSQPLLQEYVSSAYLSKHLTIRPSPALPDLFN